MIPALLFSTFLLLHEALVLIPKSLATETFHCKVTKTFWWDEERKEREAFFVNIPVYPLHLPLTFSLGLRSECTTHLGTSHSHCCDSIITEQLTTGCNQNSALHFTTGCGLGYPFVQAVSLDLIISITREGICLFPLPPFSLLLCRISKTPKPQPFT